MGCLRPLPATPLGCGHMNSLQKILYIADYMEPNRDFPGVERLRAAVAEDLDRAVLMGLEMTVDMLRSQVAGWPRIPWKPLHPSRQSACSALACEKGMGGFPSAAGSPNLPKNE